MREEDQRQAWGQTGLAWDHPGWTPGRELQGQALSAALSLLSQSLAAIAKTGLSGLDNPSSSTHSPACLPALPPHLCVGFY